MTEHWVSVITWLSFFPNIFWEELAVEESLLTALQPGTHTFFSLVRLAFYSSFLQTLLSNLFCLCQSSHFFKCYIRIHVHASTSLSFLILVLTSPVNQDDFFLQELRLRSFGFSIEQVYWVLLQIKIHTIVNVPDVPQGAVPIGPGLAFSFCAC